MEFITSEQINSKHHRGLIPIQLWDTYNNQHYVILMYNTDKKYKYLWN